MPDMTPVGSMYPPANPLSTLSAIYGIQQQRIGVQQAQQNLQTGQYTQASAQANASQDQQKNAELKAAQQLAIQGAKSGQYSNSDGTLNRQKMADDMTAIGPYAASNATQLLSQANEVVQNQQAHQNLTVSQKKEMGDTFASLAADPQVDNTKVTDAVERLRAAHPNDPNYSRLLTSMTMHMPNTASSQDLQTLLGRWSSAATGQSQIAQGTNAAGQNQVINPYTGARSAPQLGPGATNPASPAVAGATAAATLPYVGPTAAASAAGAAEGAAGTANLTGVATRVQQAQAAANNTVQSQDALNRAKAILESPGAPSTGTQYENVKGLKNLMSSLGIDTEGANDMNTLTKNLARFEAARATQAGLGGTDAARELAHSGSPNTQLDNKALLGIVRQSLATEQAVASYANVQSKTNDPAQQLKNETAFRNIPNHIQAREFGMMRNPQEADEYLKEQGMTKAQMAAARAKMKEFDTQ